MANASTTHHRSLDPAIDLFAQGFDRCEVQTSGRIMISPQFCSLNATYLRNLIVNALGKETDAHVRGSISLLSPNIVFEHPTLQLLAARISSLIDERGVSQGLDTKQQHVATMNAMIEKYSVGLSGSVTLPVVNDMTNGMVSHPTGAVVLLTGSTGALGSFLLSQLLGHPRVERVYACNRPSSSTSIEERQSSAFVDKGLSADLLSSGKLVYVEVDASRDKCGFSPELYAEVWDRCTYVLFLVLSHTFRSETR